MKDLDYANEDWIQGAWEDFDQELVKGNLENCLSIKEDVGGRGFESDALRMFKLVNAAREEQEFEYVPYTHPSPPTISPEEDDKPHISSSHESEYETIADEDGQTVIKKV